MKKREDNKPTKVHSKSHSTVVESDLNRAGEDHPQRPEAVAESVTQTAMEVNEPVTVPVTAKPTPRVTLDSYFHLDRLARRVRGEKFMSKSMALSSVLQEASPRSPPCFSFRWRWLHFVIAPFNCDYKKRGGQRKTKECHYWRTYKGTQAAAVLWVIPQACVTPLPNTVAFGELGLNYTEPEADWQEQRPFLEQLLGQMRGSLDRIHVVVHCRENNIPKRSALWGPGDVPCTRAGNPAPLRLQKEMLAEKDIMSP